jgi:hypothetical protein
MAARRSAVSKKISVGRLSLVKGKVGEIALPNRTGRERCAGTIRRDLRRPRRGGGQRGASGKMALRRTPDRDDSVGIDAQPCRPGSHPAYGALGVLHALLFVAIASLYMGWGMS